MLDKEFLVLRTRKTEDDDFTRIEHDIIATKKKTNP